MSVVGGGGAIAAMNAWRQLNALGMGDFYGLGIGKSYNGLNRYEAQRNHDDLVRKIDKAAEKASRKELSVTVRAESIRDAVESAYAILKPKADKYEADSAVFHARLGRVRDWQRARKKAKKERAKRAIQEALIQKRKVKVEEEAQKLLAERKWWEGHMTEQEARRQAELKVPAVKDPYQSWHDMYIGLDDMSYMTYRFLPSAPKVPDAYGSLPHIKQLLEAINLAPEGVLQIPIDMVRAVQAVKPPAIESD